MSDYGPRSLRALTELDVNCIEGDVVQHTRNWLATKCADSDWVTKGCSLRHISVGERALWCAGEIVLAVVSLFLRILPHTIDKCWEMCSSSALDIKVDAMW